MEDYSFESPDNINWVIPKFVLLYCENPKGLKVMKKSADLIDLETVDPYCRFCKGSSSGSGLDKLDYICSCYLPAHLKCLQKELDRLYQFWIKLIRQTSIVMFVVIILLVE